MGLISKYGLVGVNGSNVKRFEILGYNIPRTLDKNGRLTIKQGTKIKVLIEHLPKKSQNIFLDCSCDICGSETHISCANYFKQEERYKNVLLCKHCVRTFNSGENAWNWNPNLSYEDRNNTRSSKDDIVWRLKIYSKYNYKCAICKDNNNLEAHHLDGYNWCIEKRYDTNNGVCFAESII